MKRSACGAALLVLLAPAAAGAQSLLSAGGLGVPLEPLEARARAIGSVGAGIFGPSLTPTDPAAAADQRVPAVTFTLGGSWVDVEEGGASNDASGTRFPFIGVSYPVRTVGVATLTYGTLLEQRWQTRVERRIPLEQTIARVTDTFLSDGGVAALRLGFATRIAPSLAVGGSLGKYTGDATRRLSRSYDSIDAEVRLPDFRTEGVWRYSGLTATVGAMFDVAEIARVSASVDWSGDLEASPVDDTSGGGRSYDLPMVFRVGASGVLAPGLVASLGMTQADWTAAGDGNGDGAGRSTRTLGGGLEFTRASLRGRNTPFRIGYRRSELPFALGSEDPVETVLAGGLGLNLVQVGDIPRARVDFSVERGDRDAGSLSEAFWRVSVSLLVAGF